MINGCLNKFWEVVDDLNVFHIITTCKRSCGKVMFLQVSVILFTGECLLGGVPGGYLVLGGAWSWGCLVLGVPGPGGCLALGGLLPGERVPGGDPPDSYCCRQYTSYWNAFLFNREII